MISKLSSFKDPSPEFALLTNEQVWFYRLHLDLQEAFANLAEADTQLRYLEWWSMHRPRIADGPHLRLRPNVDVNLVGFFKGDVGLGEFARDTANAMSSVQIQTSIVNLPYPDSSRNTNKIFENKIQAEMNARVSLYFLPGTEHFSLAYRWNLDSLTVPYSIGYWPWELDVWPSKYRFCFEIVDEVWGMSQFVCDSFSRAHPSARVHWMPLCISLPKVEPLNIQNLLNLPFDQFVVLTAFDFNSSLERKNPMASYRAFKKEFDGDPKATFVVKCIGAAQTSTEILFLETLKNDPQAVVIDKNLSHQELLNLIRRADCFISLHRAEGFGRVMAEAMAIGTPVVATQYSGNLDFMNESNSYLVDFKIISVAPGSYPLATPDSRWADPNVEHAAAQLRKLRTDHGLRDAKIRAGQRTILESFSPEAVGTRIRDRISMIKSIS